MPRFVDTNILIYSVSSAGGEREKRDRAREILRSTDLVLSTQVLGEFYVQVTRRTAPRTMPHARAVQMIRAMTRFPIQPVTAAIVEQALATCERYRISYWDAAIIEAARAGGCSHVLSEDLSDGQDYGGVRVVNPLTT